VEITISQIENSLNSLKKQTTDLVDSTETIQGSISLNWITLGEFVEAYIPYFRIWLLCLGTIGFLVYWRYGRTRRVHLPN
jgi:hypothetical protein